MLQERANHVVFRVATHPLLLAGVVLGVMLLATGARDMGPDEGVWNYVAWAWTHHGLAPYSGAYDDKTPGVFLVFALSNLLFGVNVWFPRLLGCLSMTAAALAVYRIAGCVAGRIAGAGAMLLFGLTMAWRAVDGSYAAQTESFLVLFEVLAFLCVLSAIRAGNSRRAAAWVFAAGASVGLAISFKQVAIFTSAAMAAFYLYSRIRDGAPRRRVALGLSVASAGLAVAIGLCMAPLLASGVTAGDAWRGAWWVFVEGGTQSINPSLASRAEGFVEAWFASRIVMFLPLLVLLLALQRRLGADRRVLVGLGVWLAAAFVGVNASGNYYPHQFKQAVAPMAILGAGVLAALVEKLAPAVTRRQRSATAMLIVLVLLWLPYASLGEVFFFRVKADDSRDLSAWVRTRVGRDETVLILGDCCTNATQVMARSQRRAPSRFFCWFYLDTPAARRDLANDLAVTPPKLILLHSRSRLSLPAWLAVTLDELASQRYRRAGRKHGYEILELAG